MWEKFTNAIKSMYDSLVRTYSPMIIGAILGWLATWLPIVPQEIESGFIVLLSLMFQAAWYFVARFIEIIKGKSSKLLTLGLTKSEPVYGEVLGTSGGDDQLVLVEKSTP